MKRRHIDLLVLLAGSAGLAFSQITTTTTLTSNTPNPSGPGQTVTLIATVTPSGATGTVTFKDNGTTLGTAPLSGGTASLSTSGIFTGSQPLVASYSGDANYLASTSPSVTQGVVAANVSLYANRTSSTFGQQVTLMATVTPSSAIGSVYFGDALNGNPFGPSNQLGFVPLVSGTASIVVSTLTVGSRSLFVFYDLGNSLNIGATSAVVPFVVSQATPGFGTTGSPFTATYGGTVQGPATVTISGPAGVAGPTGTFTLTVGSSQIGGTFAAGSAVSIANAQLPASLGAGSGQTVSINYSGDTNYLASSGSATINVSKATPSLSTTGSPFTATYLGTVQGPATVTISGPAGVASPTGAFTLTVDAILIGFPFPAGNAVSIANAQLPPSIGAGSGQTLSINYLGDANYLPLSGSAILNVNKAPTTISTTGSPFTATYGGTVQGPATVTVSGPVYGGPAVGGFGPTGTFTVIAGSIQIGGAFAAGNAASIANIPLSPSIGAGNGQTVSINYSGDTNFFASSGSAILNVSAATPSYRFSATPASANPNQSVAFTLSVTSPTTGTPAGTVNFYVDSIQTPLNPTSLATANGTASFSTTNLTVGTHTISAVFTDTDGNFNSNTLSTAPTASVNVSLSCTFGLSPGIATFGTAASSGNTVTVTPAVTCGNWSVSPSPFPWLVITGGGGGGTGIGTVTYNLLANPNLAPRSETLTIAGQPFTVTQEGQGCQLSLNPPKASVSVSGGSFSLGVNLSGADCTWTAVGNAPWAPIMAGNSGTGSGTISYQVLANQSSSVSRTGTITITTSAGTTATFTITEAGTTCVYSLPRGEQAFVPVGGSGTVMVAAPGGCPWTADTSAAPFVTITAGASGSGNGSVSVMVPANTAGTPRMGVLRVAGGKFTVIQLGAGNNANCTASVATPPQVALEGRTELLGDMLVTCGGLSTVVTATLELTLNTDVTNILSGTNTIDAHLVAGGNPQSGQLTGYNNIFWMAVPMGPGTSTVRISNVRADASLLAAGGNLQPAAVTGQVNVFAGGLLPITYAPQETAGACPAGGGAAATMACAAPTLVFERETASPPAGGPVTVIPVVFAEAAAGAFTAGLTRLRLVVSDVPATVTVYAQLYPTEGQALAQLYTADANGLGGSPAVMTSGAQCPCQQLTASNGVATATWLVTTADPGTIMQYTFAMLLTNAGDLNALKLTGSLGPASGVAVASATAPIPRYRDFSVPQTLLNLRTTVKSR